tara:strand:- start:6 stop:200 length:195 start_codon:yes stop_codon:yes gene_type:complete
MKKMVQGKLDTLLEKAISRKLLVWFTATGLMLTANLESADWVIISGLYLGGQGIIDAIAKLKGA